MNNGIRSLAATRRGLPGSSKNCPTASLILRIFSALFMFLNYLDSVFALYIYKFMKSEEEYQIERQLLAELFSSRQKFVYLMKICRYHVYH